MRFPVSTKTLSAIAQAFVMTCIFCSSGAWGGVIIEGSVIDLPIAQNQTNTPDLGSKGKYGVIPTIAKPITYSGRRPPLIAQARYPGSRMSFSGAAKLIVPEGWKGFILDERIKQINDMTWETGGREWTDVLAELLVSHRLSAKVDWDRKEINFDIDLPYK